jgi:hypothetical protein
MNRRRIAVLSAAISVGLASLIGAPPAQAAAASPGSHTVDCTTGSEVISNQTFVGTPGDTFTITNQSGSSACVVAGYSGVVTATGLIGASGEYLPSGPSTATFTIVTSGSFTLTSGGVTGTMTVSTGGSSATVAAKVASGPPAVTATPGPNMVQLAIWPGPGGTGSALLYEVVVASADLKYVEAFSVASTSADGPTIATYNGLLSSQVYTFSVKEMTSDSLWSTATGVTAQPLAQALCGSLSVTVAQPTGLGAGTITSPVTAGTSLTSYPFIAPPYGGTVKEFSQGSWNEATRTGSPGGEYVRFLPQTTNLCEVRVRAPEGVLLTSSIGGPYTAGSRELVTFSGVPVYAFGTKTGTHEIAFTADGAVLKATPKVRIGTVRQAGYTLAVSPEKQTLKAGAVSSVTVKVTDAFGNPVPDVAVVALSSGSALLAGYAESILMFADPAGTGTVPVIAAPAAGTATITARWPADTRVWAQQPGYVIPAGFPTPTTSVQAQVVVEKPVERTIIITGERTTVSGKPGITVTGITTGFAPGALVKPYFRFPGETSYTEGSARPEVDASGEFSWSRKTGKKFYAYVVSEDGLVQSNRVIIPAN